jgi:hypothetical protein
MFPACVLPKDCWQLIMRGMLRGWFLRCNLSVQCTPSLVMRKALWLTAWWLQSMLQQMTLLEMACPDETTIMIIRWTMKAESYLPFLRAKNNLLSHPRSFLGGRDLALTLLRERCK